jgi:hypothetical protein
MPMGAQSIVDLPYRLPACALSPRNTASPAIARNNLVNLPDLVEIVSEPEPIFRPLDRRMAFIRSIMRGGLTLAMLGMPVQADDLNDYPTTARVDYVFACMKANQETRRALEQCSCSIDIIASIVPYERYVTAETFLSLAQIPGERGAQFRGNEESKSAVNDLRRAQAEAEVRCF